MYNKILILSVSVGAGHVQVARALEAAFKERIPSADIRHINALDYTNKIFRTFYHDAYMALVAHAPSILGSLYDSSDKPWERRKRRKAMNKVNAYDLYKMLREENPDLIVCTHFLPAEIVSNMKAKGELTGTHAVVVTDIDPHAFWFCRNYDHYFVAMDESAVYLGEEGIDADKITVTGIPIGRVFSEEKDKHTCRKNLGLAPDKTTLLVTTGGCGCGPVQSLLEELSKMNHACQIVVICGNNKELKADLEKALPSIKKDHIDFHLTGFTRQMDEYMTASDLLLGKTGGVTLSEAMAKTLPMVIIDPLRGQEERNADHLLEEGVAIRCNNFPTIAFKIDRILDNPDRLEQMRKNASRLARPHACTKIIDTLVSSEKD